MARITVRDASGIRFKLNQAATKLARGGELTRAIDRASILIESEARRHAPVDTGQLRASITHNWRSSPLSGGTRFEVRIGPTVRYGVFMEVGARPHWPPIDALRVWARRHGTSPFVVARAIARRGIEGRFYMLAAFHRMYDTVRRELEAAVDRVLRQV